MQHVGVEEFLELSDGTIVLLALVNAELLNELFAALLLLASHELCLALGLETALLVRASFGRSMHAAVDIRLSAHGATYGSSCIHNGPVGSVGLYLITTGRHLERTMLAHILLSSLGLDLSFTVQFYMMKN